MCNKNYISIMILLIFILFMSYIKFWVDPQKEIRNQEILRHALELYVKEGKSYLKDVYGTTMKYESYYSTGQVYLTIESAGQSKNFDNYLDNTIIRWSVETEFLIDVPVDQHLELGTIIFIRNFKQLKSPMQRLEDPTKNFTNVNKWRVE